MKDILGYFANPFASPHYGLPALFSFTTDHLERMKANNPGGWLNARIAATSAAWDSYSQCESTEMGKVALRRAGKMRKKIFRTALREKLARIQAIMIGKYGLRAPQVTEAFGKNRTKIMRATDDGLAADLKAVAAAVTAHAAELGAALVADAQGLVTDWAAVYDESESATGAKASAQEEKRLARAALQVELFKNLLAVVAQFPGEPEKLSLYMQKHLLRVGRKKRE